MANITVLDNKTSKALGSGTGNINKPNATINAWTDKAGLQTNKQYKLKSSGKTYNATCNTVNNAAPVATFINVE